MEMDRRNAPPLAQGLEVGSVEGVGMEVAAGVRSEDKALVSPSSASGCLLSSAWRLRCSLRIAATSLEISSLLFESNRLQRVALLLTRSHWRCTILAQKCSSWVSVDAPLLGMVQLHCKPLWDRLSRSLRSGRWSNRAAPALFWPLDRGPPT